MGKKKQNRGSKIFSGSEGLKTLIFDKQGRGGVRGQIIHKFNTFSVENVKMVLVCKLKMCFATFYNN